LLKVKYIVVFRLNDILVSITTQRDGSYTRKKVLPFNRRNFTGKQIVVFTITGYVLRSVTNAISRLNHYKHKKEFIKLMSHVHYT